jgi:hypothetical protein
MIQVLSSNFAEHHVSMMHEEMVLLNELAMYEAQLSTLKTEETRKYGVLESIRCKYIIPIYKYSYKSHTILYFFVFCCAV